MPQKHHRLIELALILATLVVYNSPTHIEACQNFVKVNHHDNIIGDGDQNAQARLGRVRNGIDPYIGVGFLIASLIFGWRGLDALYVCRWKIAVLLLIGMIGSMGVGLNLCFYMS